MNDTSVTADRTPVDDAIPTAELMDLVRRYAGSDGSGWCSDVERALTKGLGIEFERSGCTCAMCARPGVVIAERFTPKPGSPTSFSRNTVVALIREVRKEYPGYAKGITGEAIAKWGLDARAAYRVRVTVELDGWELEAEGDGWKTADDGTPVDLADDDLRYAARHAIFELTDDRLTVEVVR